MFQKLQLLHWHSNIYKYISRKCTAECIKNFNFLVEIQIFINEIIIALNFPNGIEHILPFPFFELFSCTVIFSPDVQATPKYVQIQGYSVSASLFISELGKIPGRGLFKYDWVGTCHWDLKRPIFLQKFAENGTHFQTRVTNFKQN